ncbi:zinc-dependent alcohol dehydrogenase family protein [Raineyella sp. LH-20]|uniref:zinc-dependent alcohol dehydrogenase family protein n=1 Tax=Raineyella sp. LH-20 TaxID=3081204 RepID=UPI0029554BA8|nr:zinc-dependent alcohol dehydrogenase family protein [Raineyella sp. LH-20]WOP18182.1 zinc-dependent alcohol dehydrogenase family protein [Raineyella sp. LH-20]
MKALVYHGPGQQAWEDVPDPTVQEPTDCVVKVETTTICGTDLHIMKGDVPTVTDGRILGHEGVGTITAVGSAVGNFAVGDRVIISCITSCGTCSYCRKGLPSHCQTVGGIGWILGHLIDGVQAEYVRIPYADTSLYHLPAGVTDEQGLFVSDILPTGYEIGVRDGGVKPGDVVAVIGTGPVGLAAIMTAGLHGASRVIAVDLDDNRLDLARSVFGATHTVNSGTDGWADTVRGLTDGLGVDVAIEAVGLPTTFGAALSIIRPGGQVANVGVHGTSVDLPVNEKWSDNIRISMGLVNAVTGDMLLKMIAEGKLPVDRLATHRFRLDQIVDAYDTFGHAARTKALKVVMTA